MYNYYARFFSKKDKKMFVGVRSEELEVRS